MSNDDSLERIRSRLWGYEDSLAMIADRLETVCLSVDGCKTQKAERRKHFIEPIQNGFVDEASVSLLHMDDEFHRIHNAVSRLEGVTKNIVNEMEKAE